MRENGQLRLALLIEVLIYEQYINMAYSELQ